MLKPEVLAVNPLEMEVDASICRRLAAFLQQGQQANNFAKPFLNDLKNQKNMLLASMQLFGHFFQKPELIQQLVSARKR